MQDLALNCV